MSLDLERARRSMEIFLEVCGLSSSDKNAALDRLCGDDEALRKEVDTLLAADSSEGTAIVDQAESFIAEKVRQIDDRPTLRAEAPSVEGEYTILRLIGEGGMGSVYEAEQHAPRRRVALKVIRPGRITPQLRKRFEYEAEVLGRLEHPGIARLYEFDTHAEEGRLRAFLAMELVIGEPIDVHCTVYRLELPARLRLFQKVCAAVAYAHRMGVIHRDLKPANILVTADGEPKILDFGVARTIGEDRLATQSLTQHGQIIGTLAYMSPEQVDGSGDIDTRADVYALGVVLYKLLTGELPIKLDNASLAGATDRLLNEVPVTVGTLDKRLKGDLEIIVARSLEKNPDRRYASVEQLSDEIDRFLSGKPIEARGDSTFYLVRKTLWRYRAAAGVALTLITLLVAFGIYASVAAERNHRSALLAETARDSAVDAQTRATEKAEALRHALYVSGIGFAQSALENNDIDRVHRLLDASDPTLRGWEWSYIQRQCDLSTASRAIPLEQPRYASSSSDHSRVAYASLSRDVLLLDADGTEKFRTQFGVGSTRVALSADGKTLAYSSFADAVSVLDVDSGRRRELADPTPSRVTTTYRSSRVMSLANHDQWVVAAGWEGLLRVWDVSSGQLLRTIDVGAGRPLSIVVLPDGQNVVIGDNTGSLNQYDLKEGKLVRSFPGHDSPIWALVLSEDGTVLASGDNDARTILWNLADGSILTRADTNDGWITTMAFNKDRSMLAVGRADSTIRLLHLPDGYNLATLRGHRRAIVHLEFTGKDELQSLSLDGTTKTWDLAATLGVPTILSKQPQTIGFAITPDGKQLIVGGGDGSVLRYDVEGVLTNHPVKELPPLPALKSPVLEVVLDPSGKRVCYTGRDGSVRIVDLASATVLQDLPSMYSPVSGVAFTTDGKHLVVGAAGGLTIFDIQSGLATHVIPMNGCVPNEVRIDPTTNDILVACSDGALHRWTAQGVPNAAEVALDPTGLYDMTFSPDGKTLAVSGDIGPITLLDARTLKVLRTLPGHQGPVTCVVFHPSGNRLASCGHDRTIRLWDLDTGTELITLRGHRGAIQEISFTPEADLLISTSDDGTVRLWNGSSK